MAQGFHAQGLVNTVWAFAKLIYDDIPLVQTMAKLVQLQAENFRLQWLVRSIWAFAKLRFEDWPFFHLMMTLVSKKEEDFQVYDMQVTTNFVWAMGRVAYLDSDGGAMEAVGRVAGHSRLLECDFQGLANMLWRMAVLEMASPVAAMATPVAARLPEFEPQNLSNVAWAMAKVAWG